MRAMCDVNWGSHGCHRPKGHDGWCVCGFECGNMTFPYYGPDTRFYGDDAEVAQARLDDWYAKHERSEWPTPDY